MGKVERVKTLDRTNVEKRMFSSSAISDYMGCPRYFYWKKVRGLEKKGEKKLSREFGRVFHKVLLEWYRSNDEGEAVKAFSSLPPPQPGDMLTREWGEAVFKKYVRRYEKEAGRTLHLEVNFRVEIADRLYIGVIDRIEDWGGQIYADDHKTTRALGLSFFNSFRPNPQIDGYCWVVRELAGRCSGAVINGISVAANPKERFQRFISPRTEEEMDTWTEVFRDTTDDILRDYDRQRWPMRTTHCNRWGECPYKALCIHHNHNPELRERFIEQAYEVRTE